MNKPVLEVKGLCVGYGRIRVLNDFSFSLAQGETLALLGANGAGKTSAVEAIAGLLPKAAGQVSFLGRDITKSSAATLANSGLALVPQWRELFPTFTVEETLAAALNAGRRRGRTEFADVYELFPRLAERRRQLAGTLSGGEQQMLAIGRSLVTEPRVLVLDEPTAGLAAGIVRDLIAALLTIKERGTPILLVEQNMDLASAIAEKGLILSAGREVWRGKLEEAIRSEDVRRLYFGTDKGRSMTSTKNEQTDALSTIDFRNSSRRRLLGETLRRNAVNFGGRIALHDIDTGWQITFDELHHRADAIASGLVRKGLKPGNRICILGRNYVDTLALYYAIARIGAIAVPLNTYANTGELRYIIEDSCPSMAIVADDISGGVDASLFSGLPVFSLTADGKHGDVATWAAAGETFEQREVDDRAGSFLLYTGGTTGKPKGVLLSQAGYVTMAEATVQALAPQGFSRSDSWLILGPLYHGAALAYSIIGLAFGQTVHLMREYNATVALDSISKGFGTITWFIPTMSRRTIDHVNTNRIALDTLERLRLIISAGAPLSLELRNELKQTFRKCEVIDIVGQTEMTSTLIVHAEPDAIRRHPTAVGLPAPGITVALLDDDARPVGPGEVGEICYLGESMMLGYWNKPDVTAQSMIGGWFHSGDLGRRDQDGLLFIVGRKKELIKTGGENVIPNEVEDVLRAIPGVTDACVLGVKDPVWGERVHAVLAVGSGSMDPQAMAAKAEQVCRAALSRYKVPKTWTVLATLPANAIGKVDKAALRATIGDGNGAVDMRAQSSSN